MAKLPSNLSQLGIAVCGTIFPKYKHYYIYPKITLCKRIPVYRHSAGIDLHERPNCPECELRIVHHQTDPENE